MGDAGTDPSGDCANFTSLRFIAAIDFSAIDFSRPSLECGEVRLRAEMLFFDRGKPLGPAVVNPSAKWILEVFTFGYHVPIPFMSPNRGCWALTQPQSYNFHSETRPQ